MAYTEFTDNKPDPTVDDGAEALDYDRGNQMALRDLIICGVGLYQGWDCEAQDSDGTPATDPLEPDQVVWDKGVYRVKAEFTWGTTGATDGMVLTVTVSYSSDSGSSYDTILGGTTNGIFTNSYDANGYWISGAWS